jgi:hypothetical protein
MADWLDDARARVLFEVRRNPVRAHAALASLAVFAARYAPGVDWTTIIAFVVTTLGVGEATRANVTPLAKIGTPESLAASYQAGYRHGREDTGAGPVIVDVTPGDDPPVS